MMGAKKGAWMLLMLVCLTAVGGYALARHALSDCTRDTVNELIMSGVNGQNPDGTLVLADQIPITARVALPFVVDVYYSVPFNLRTIQRGNRYVVLPGYTIKEPLPVLRSLPLSNQAGHM